MARSFVAKLFVATLTGTATWSLCATSEAQSSRPTPARRQAAKAPQELGVTGARPITRPTGNLIAQAYQKTQDAATIEDYTEIVQLCQHALPGEQDPSVRKYVEQLLAWAANRRGEAYSQEASQYHAAGQTEKALKSDEQALGDFTIAVQHDPSKWKSLHNKGVSLALVGRYDEAVEDLTKALELKNDYVNTWFNRAEVRYELGQFEDAIADYGEVIQRQPDDFGAFTGRGHAYFRLGDFEKALADYHRAVTLDKESAGALVNRGDTYRQMGQYEKAAADYRTAVKLDEGLGRAYRSAAWLMATCPNDKLRNPELAVRAAEKAIELDGADDYLYLDVLAAAYANAGKYSEAVQTLEAALPSAPEEAQEPLQERLALFQGGKPYRLAVRTVGKPTPARR